MGDGTAGPIDDTAVPIVRPYRRQNANTEEIDMFVGGTPKIRGLLSAATCFCLLTLAGGPIAAQQVQGVAAATDNLEKTAASSKQPASSPKAASERSELEEMSATVKQLQDRISELEAKLARLESAAAQPAKAQGLTPAASVTPGATASMPPAAATEVVQASDQKKDDRKQEEENAG